MLPELKPPFAPSPNHFWESTQWANLRSDILMSRGKDCRETIFVIRLSRTYPHRRGNFERGKIALSCGREAVWEAFLKTTWARVIASQKLSRDSGETIFATRHQDVSQGPLRTIFGLSPRTFGLQCEAFRCLARLSGNMGSIVLEASSREAIWSFRANSHGLEQEQQQQSQEQPFVSRRNYPPPPKSFQKKFLKKEREFFCKAGTSLHQFYVMTMKFILPEFSM